MDNTVSVHEVKDLLDQIASIKKAMHGAVTSIAHQNEQGILPGQFHILVLLEESSGLNQKEIARMMHVSPATLSVRLERLEQLGYICKTVSSKDKRNVVLSISEKGRKQIQEGKEAMCQLVKSFLDGFSSEEISLLKSYITRIEGNMKKVKGDYTC